MQLCKLHLATTWSTLAAGAQSIAHNISRERHQGVPKRKIGSLAMPTATNLMHPGQFTAKAKAEAHCVQHRMEGSASGTTAPQLIRGQLREAPNFYLHMKLDSSSTWKGAGRECHYQGRLLSRRRSTHRRHALGYRNLHQLWGCISCRLLTLTRTAIGCCCSSLSTLHVFWHGPFGLLGLAVVVVLTAVRTSELFPVGRCVCRLLCLQRAGSVKCTVAWQHGELNPGEQVA